MDEPLTTALLILNASFPDHTSWPGDDNQMTFASAYLQHDVTHMLWMIVPPLLLVLGSYGNVMTIVVMRAMRASESTGCLSVYFTALAVSDLFLLWTNVLLYWPEMALDTPLAYFDYTSCTVPFFVSYTFTMTSAWFLVAMSYQRMTSVVLPHRVKVLCTARKGTVVTATIVIISCVENLYIFFYFDVEYVEEGYPSCVNTDKYVADIFNYLHLCLASVVPFVVLIIANTVLISEVIQSAKMSNKLMGHVATKISSPLAKVSSMSMTLILTSAAFLFLTLPSCALLIYFDVIGYYEGHVDDNTLIGQLALVDTVCILLWMSNSSVNFYLYVLSGRRFRQETKRYLCLLFKERQQ